MKKVLYIILILLIVSCSKSDPTVPNVEQSAVSFDTNNDWAALASLASRGEAKTVFDAGDEIGILAYYFEGEESISEVTPNFMYNQLVTYQQEDESYAWVYSPIKYWPNKTNDKLQFFAYYPYNVDNNTEEGNKAVLELRTSNTDKDYPIIYFEQTEVVGNQIDFMTSQTLPLEKCDIISLPFSHQLTQVGFAARHNGVSTDNVTITKLIMTIDNAYTALEGTFNDTQFNAETIGDKQTMSYVLEGDYLLSGNPALLPTMEDVFYKTVNTDKGMLMLPPQTIGQDCVKIIATIDIDRGWNEDDYQGTVEITLNVPSDHNYVAGQAILYQFTIDLETTKLTFDIENIMREVWKEGTEITEYTEDGEDTENTGTIW